MTKETTVTLARGKETLEVTAPTYGGITALERLGWEIQAGRKPARPKAQPKAEPFDEAAARDEIEASLRAELETQIRAEVAAEQAKAEKAAGDKKPAGKK